MTNPTASLDADRLQAIHAWNTHWSDHDIARLIELFVDDFIYEDVPTHRVNHGGAELRAFAEEVFKASSDVRYEISHAIVSGDRGSAELTILGTHTGNLEGIPATGKSFEVRGHSAFEFEGARIKRCSDYWCIATMLKQLGLLPS